MNVIICKDKAEIAEKACEIIKNCIKTEESPLISFPGGDSPLKTIKNFVEAVNNGEIDIKNTTFVSLDEWVGLKASDEGSCGHFLNTNLFNPLQKDFKNKFVLNGAAEDIEAERNRHQEFFNENGPLDLSVLGVGMNGHLGFNESGVDFSLNSHIIDLDDVTKKVMVKYFGETQKPEKGITQGINQIMQAKTVILIADGEHKAEIIKKTIKGEVSNSVPASVLQNHPNAYVIIDTLAAKYL